VAVGHRAGVVATIGGTLEAALACTRSLGSPFVAGLSRRLEWAARTDECRSSDLGRHAGMRAVLADHIPTPGLLYALRSGELLEGLYAWNSGFPAA
jgi:hypothetical protein